MNAALDACSTSIAVQSDDADLETKSFSNESDVDELEDAAEAVRNTADKGLRASSLEEEQPESLCPDIACQILDARGIKRRFTPARLADHMARRHPHPDSPKDAATKAMLLRLHNKIVAHWHRN